MGVQGTAKDLRRAYDQLLRYKDDLENPPLLVVSDLDVIEVHTNLTDTVKQVHRITLDTITTEASLRVLRALFFDPRSLRPKQTPEAVTKAAAERFGELHSRAHEVWSLRMGTSLEDRPRYTPTTTFEAFPLPWPPGEEPWGDPRLEAIAAAARELNELRERWLNPSDATEAELKKRTPTNLYNVYPTWLGNAHARLDRAVWGAYGWPADETPAEAEEDAILSRLLALSQERASNELIQ